MPDHSFFPQPYTTNASVSPTNLPGAPAYQKQPLSEKRISDPSSCMPSGETYPVPHASQFRVEQTDYDTL